MSAFFKGPKNSFVWCPEQDGYVFGSLPQMNSGRDIVLGGDIFLKIGRHFGPNSGFGANHLWADHMAAIASFPRLEGIDHFYGVALALVVSYVTAIIQPGTPVYCEFASIGKYRPAVLSSKAGTVILEEREDEYGECYYSVVTAYDLRRPKGTLIGRVL